MRIPLGLVSSTAGFALLSTAFPTDHPPAFHYGAAGQSPITDHSRGANAPNGTIVVSSSNDSGPGSLRQALATANNGDTIQFDPALNGQIISITSSELTVASNVTINGPGPSLLTIARSEQAPPFGVFHIMPGAIVSIVGLTITGGSTEQAFSTDGGGILNDQATLSVNNCIIHHNTDNGAYGGGGIASIGQNARLTVASSTIRNNTSLFGSGGGVRNYEGTLTIIESTISENNAAAFSFNRGGGIASFDGLMVINNSTITNNHASDGGGGIDNSSTATITNTAVSSNIAGNQDGGGGNGGGILNGGSLTILHSTVTGNTATGNFAEGGGISNGNALIITESTISNNQADKTGGGIFSYGTVIITGSTLNGNHAGSASLADSGFGGGFYGQQLLTIQNSTLSDNSAFLDGGAVSFYFGTLTVANTTISDNAAGRYGGGIYNSDHATVEMTNSLFKAGLSGVNIFNDGGTITSHGYNLSS